MESVSHKTPPCRIYYEVGSDCVMVGLAMYLYILERFFFAALHIGSGYTFPKPLTAKEERECLARIQTGDKSARERLILHNLRLVAHIIKKYYSGYKDGDDLISIGTIGLIKAVSSFKFDKGVRFATYAARCIESKCIYAETPVLKPR
jgi:RNA polymerase sporulation-specific sigma factor